MVINFQHLGESVYAVPVRNSPRMRSDYQSKSVSNTNPQTLRCGPFLAEAEEESKKELYRHLIRILTPCPFPGMGAAYSECNMDLNALPDQDYCKQPALSGPRVHVPKYKYLPKIMSIFPNV